MPVFETQPPRATWCHLLPRLLWLLVRVENKRAARHARTMLFSLLLLFAGQPDVEEAKIRLAKEKDQHALNLTRAGAYSEAARQLVRSLQIWQELSTTRSIDLVGPHFNLASTYLALGRIAAAEKEA